MSFTEDCEMELNRLGINTENMTNKEIRDMYGELKDIPIDW